MGGNLPLGYDLRDRKLVVNEQEAETVRHIYRRYVALRSVRLLAEDLEADGITSKRRVNANGRQWGGCSFGRGALYILLQNRIYLGEITHKDRHYPGQHDPILDRALWDEAQALLAANAGDRRAGSHAKQPSLLAGLIFDDRGHRMTPTHAVKSGKRYRYYISQPLVTQGRGKAPDACRIPAAEVEQVVCDRVRVFLADAGSVFDAVSATTAGTEPRRDLVAQAAELATSWPDLPSQQQRRIIAGLVARIVVEEENVALHLVPSRLCTVLHALRHGDDLAEASDGGDPDVVVLSAPVRLQRIGKGGHLIVHGDLSDARPNAALIGLLVRAHQMRQILLGGPKRSIHGLAAQADLSRNYTNRLLRLSWLAPDITQAIMRGQQPPTLTADKLSRSVRIPIDWQAQRIALGFK